MGAHVLVHFVRGSRSPRTRSDCVGGVVYDLSRDHRSRVCLGSLLIAVSAPQGVRFGAFGCVSTRPIGMEPELYMAATSFEVLLWKYAEHEGKACPALTKVLVEAYSRLGIDITQLI